MTSDQETHKINASFAKQADVPEGAMEVMFDEAGIRVDRWLATRLEGLTRSRLKELIKAGRLTRHGEVFQEVSWKIRTGEIYVLSVPPLADAAPMPEDIPLQVLHEDADLLVIHKPAGMVVHPAAGNWSGTLVNAVLYHCGDSLSGIGGVARPGIVHRLDKETSGVMVVAKHDKAHQGLAKAFAAHDIERTYQAIIHGAPRPGIGTIEAPLKRSGADRKKMAVVPEETSNARNATTHYKMLERFGSGRAKLPGDALASLVECQLETGRTHQIRVHMAHIGNPLLGDPVYGRAPGLAGLKPGDPAADAALKVLGTFHRQALHARILGFDHPVSGETMRFEADPPTDFQALVMALGAL